MQGEILIGKEVLTNVEHLRRMAGEAGYDKKWVQAAIEVSTCYTYSISSINKKWVPEGYTLSVQNEGTEKSTKIYWKDELIGMAANRGAAKRKILKHVVLPPEFLLINPGPGGEYFFHRIVDGVLQKWLKYTDGTFVRGYTRQEAKYRLLEFLYKEG